MGRVGLTVRVTEWLIRLMENLGSPGAGLAVALESVFPPIPSELVLPLAGFAASQGSLNVVAAVAWTTVGSLVGAAVLYGLGAWLGEPRLRRIAGRLPLVQPADLDRTDAWFHRHGSKAVFFGRMIPVFRSLVSIPAGVSRMPLLRFGLLTAAGSLVWNTALILAGYLLGEQWNEVRRYVGYGQEAVLVVLAVVVVVCVVRRVRQRRTS